MSQLIEMAMLAKQAAEGTSIQTKAEDKPSLADAIALAKKASEAEVPEKQAADNTIDLKTMAARGAGLGGAIGGVTGALVGGSKGALTIGGIGALAGGAANAFANRGIQEGLDDNDYAAAVAKNTLGLERGMVGTTGAGVGAGVGAIAGMALGNKLKLTSHAAQALTAAGGAIGGVAGAVGGYKLGPTVAKQDGQAAVNQRNMFNYLSGNKKEASRMLTIEEIQMAKVAAEEMCQAAIDEANEKIAFAQMLYNEANGAEHFVKEAAVKEAQDNGPALQVPYIDQVKTPAGATALCAGAGVGGVLGYMKNPSAVGAVGGGVLGAGVVAGAGALKAFIDQHRMQRAQQHAAQMGNLPQQGQ